MILQTIKVFGWGSTNTMHQLTVQELISKLQNLTPTLRVKVVDTGGFFTVSFDLSDVKEEEGEVWLCVE